MIVTLTKPEMLMCYSVGGMRRIASESRGCFERHGLKRADKAKAVYCNIVGAMGECAAGKGLGVYWPMSVNAPKGEPDLLPDIQVRTLAESHYDLWVRPDDVPAHRYVLVTGDPPTFELHGWIWGHEAESLGVLKDLGDRGAPIWCVPQDRLHPLDAIHATVAA